MLNFLNTYKNIKVLVTGHTGFKGSWLVLWLKLLGAEVVGVALDPRTNKDNYVLSGIEQKITDYRVDIRNKEQLHEIIAKEKPEVLFHLAAQPIVLDSYNNPVETYETNIMGTVHLLEAFRNSESLHTGIFVTSDKCYENREWVWGYRENDPMGGHDPYSSSKGAAELVIQSYRQSFFSNSDKNIASVRAGNVIGGGDWSPFRIVVDLVKAIETGKPLEVRNPNATRPWQHVLEPLGAYLLLGAKMMEQPGRFDEAWNFGPESANIASVKALVESFIHTWGQGTWEDQSDAKKLHEANLLALDISKARHRLNWQPKLSFHKTVQYTVDWYKNYKTENVMNLCINQIKDYIAK